MIKTFFEAIGIYRDGQLDKLRLVLIVLPIVFFMLRRLSSGGVVGGDAALAAIKRDLLVEYKAERYKEDAGFSYQQASELDNLSVYVSNVSMAGSLFSLGAVDPMAVRLNYRIEKDGDVLEQERNVYFCSHKQSRSAFWRCNAVSYYLKYL